MIVSLFEGQNVHTLYIMVSQSGPRNSFSLCAEKRFEKVSIFTTHLSNYSGPPSLHLAPPCLCAIFLHLILLLYNALLEPLALDLSSVTVQVHLLETYKASLVVELPADEEDEEDGNDNVGDLRGRGSATVRKAGREDSRRNRSPRRERGW